MAADTEVVAGHRLQFRVLGPVEVLHEGETLDLGVYKQRALLSLLLINANDVVSTDRIIDDLWGKSAGKDRQNALWVVVSRLRSLLDPDRPRRSDGTVLLTRAPGYMLVVPDDDLDSVRFERLAREGRSLLEADPARASVVLGEALALWRGRPLEEFAYEEFAAPEIARLDELRLAAVEDRIDADLRVGRSRELIGELESLTRQHPRRERLAGHLMLALHRSGRQGDALRAFGTLRTYLGEELGLDPSPDLSKLEERIVLDDPALGETHAVRQLSGRAEPGLSVRGYELREQIGAGAMGNVYRAFQSSVGREVAIKVIRPEVANDPDFIRRFESEARTIAQLEHPRIVPIYDFWREPDSAYLVMRYFERRSLGEAIEHGPLSTEDAVGVIEQVGTALAAAHRRDVVHGDVKPENVLIDGDGNAYLADFGLASNLAADAANRHDAPEVRSGGQATSQSDIYSFGILAELALGGSVGNGAAADSPLVGPAGVVVARARADDPVDRYRDVESFVDAFHTAMGEGAESLDTAVEVPNPYRGLRAFAEGDAGHFFGRERLVERLLTRLGDGRAAGRFVALVGPSGSGKSSVIRAGLLPAIRQGALTGSDRWFVTTMLPGRHPFESLEGALRSIAVNPPADLLERLASDGLAAAVEAINPDRSAQIVIVVDQLEELFAQTTDAAAGAFLDTLATAANDPHSGVKIVATLRADFYDHPLRHPLFGELLRVGTEVITPMTPPELERAVTGPAAGVGVAFEAGLVTQITADVTGQPNSLPLLQYALTELFERRTGSTISIDAYRELGGVTAALARRADSLHDGLTAEQRPRLREVFLRLVTLTEGAADTRRRALLSELADAAGEDVGLILESFGRHRLLTFDRDPITRGPTVEIAHEALIGRWARLRDWIDDARVDVRAQRALAAAAADWHERHGDPDFLLVGARLGRYDGWLAQPPVRLTDDETSFLRASHVVAEQNVEHERHRVRRLRRLVAGVGAALVVALIAGGVAFRQQRLATAETERAEQATLISRSAAAINDDPALAVLLALEAHEREPGGEARRGLLASLGGASTANKVVSRPALDGDCLPASESFYTDTAAGVVGGGPVQLQVIDGQAVARDAVSGETADLGPMPFPCALGGVNNGIGGAGDIEGRIWVGPDFVELEVRGSTLGVTTDRMIVASGAEDAQVGIYNMNGALIAEPFSGVFVAGFAISPDGSMFAASVGSTDGRASDSVTYVVETMTGEVLAAIEQPSALAISFDSFTGELIVARGDGVVAVFDPTTGDQRSQIATDETFGYLDVGARSDGMLITVSRSNIEVLDPTSGPIGRPFPIQDVRQAFVRPDGLVVTIGNDGGADVYDLDANAVVEQTFDVLPRGWIATVGGVAAVLQERSTSQGADGPAVELIDLATGNRTTPELRMPDNTIFPALAAYPAPDGVWAVSGDHRLARWRDGELVDELFMGSEAGVVNDGYYPGGRMLGDLLAVLGIRPDGRKEATLVRLDDSTPNGSSVVFTVETDMVVLDSDNQWGMAHPSPNGGLFVIDETGRLVEFGPTGQVVAEYDVPEGDATAITLDPSGNKLAMSFLEGGVTIVDLANGVIEEVPGNHVASSLGFNGDGTVLGISVWGGEIRLHEVGSGASAPIIWDGTGTYGAEPGWYDAETDSLWLPASGKVLQIPLGTDRWIAQACKIVGRVLTPDEWDRNVPGDQPLRSVCT